MSTIKKISLAVMTFAYIVLGINHFANAPIYLSIIPSYLPYPIILNALAGFFEILFGILLIFPQSRSLAAWGIILMLIAFIPVHIDMIRNAPFKLGHLTISTVIAWTRLPLQGVLIWWAWWHANK